MTADKFYADNFQELSMEIASCLNTQGENVSNLLTGMQDLANSNAISGQGADAMRDYITEVHINIINGMLNAMAGFQTAIGVYWQGYQAQDSNGNFKFIASDFSAHQQKLSQTKSKLEDYRQQLISAANSVSYLVGLGTAGAGPLNMTEETLDRMRQIAQNTSTTWQDYEQKNDGFDKVEELLTRLKDLVNTYRNSVNVGRNYVTGSFFQTAGDFITAYQAMTDFDNQYSDTANKAWSNLQADYKADVKRIQAAAKAAAEKAKKKAQQDGIFGLITDVLQVVAGAAIMVAGGILTPFTGGVSLPLVILGGMMVAGGVNSAINHTSMIISGKGYNLAGNISSSIGQWYDKNIGKSLGTKGVGGAINGFLSESGEMVSGMAQFNVVDTTKGLYNLASHVVSDPLGSLGEVWSAGSNLVHQVATGNTYVLGQGAAIAASFLVGGGEVKGAVEAARLSDATSLLSKTSVFAKTLAVETVENGKSLLSLPTKMSDVLKDTPYLIKSGFSEVKVATAAGAQAFARSVSEDSGKLASTNFDFVKATEENAKSLAKATASGIKEAKTVFQTEKVINKVESGKVALTSNLEKGNYGEMKMDQVMRDKGYQRISNDQVTSLTQQGHQGIDGVYYKADGHPPYVVGEAKYGSSSLGTTNDGRQMSQKWIDNRLSKAVGEKKAIEIKGTGYDSKLFKNIKTNGSYTEKGLDIKGYIERGGK